MIRVARFSGTSNLVFGYLFDQMSTNDTETGRESAGGLRRTLGLYAVLTISIGAMIGSGIFVLPGLAFKIAGPSVVLAFFLAGLVVLPAALSKAEMATAMPEAGGSYLYIDRAMGPLMGTIAGFGVWFSLVFKASFARLMSTAASLCVASSSSKSMM